MIMGVTCRVRTRREHRSKLVVTCKECGYVRRIPLKKKEEKSKKI